METKKNKFKRLFATPRVNAFLTPTIIFIHKFKKTFVTFL